MPLVEVDADEFAQLNAEYKATLLKLDTVTAERDALSKWAHKQNMAVTEIMEHMRAHGIGLLELWDGRTSLPELPK